MEKALLPRSLTDKAISLNNLPKAMEICYGQLSDQLFRCNKLISFDLVITRIS